jgi:hypothetical protein
MAVLTRQFPKYLKEMTKMLRIADARAEISTSNLINTKLVNQLKGEIVLCFGDTHIGDMSVCVQ